MSTLESERRAAAQYERRKLIDGALHGDSYEYEYDGVKIAYKEPQLPAASADEEFAQKLVRIETEYVSSFGLESAITSRGLDRALLPTEYEIAFKLFPGLRQATIDKVWPDQTNLTLLTVNVLSKAAQTTANKQDVSPSSLPTLYPYKLSFSLPGNNTADSSWSEDTIQQLSSYLRQASDSRNITLRVNTLLQLGVNINSHIKQILVPDISDRSAGDNTVNVQSTKNNTFNTTYMTVLNLHTLALQLLSFLPPHQHAQSNHVQYYTQDIVLRVMLIVLIVLQAGLRPQDTATVYYADYRARAQSGKGSLPPAEAVELAIQFIFGKFETVEDEEFPLESVYKVLKT